MPFFLLHDIVNPHPKTAADYEYIIFNENEIEGIPFKFHDDNKRSFCTHRVNQNPKWSYDDDVIEVLGHFGNVEASFVKDVDFPNNFTVWKRATPPLK